MDDVRHRRRSAQVLGRDVTVEVLTAAVFHRRQRAATRTGRRTDPGR